MLFSKFIAISGLDSKDQVAKYDRGLPWIQSADEGRFSALLTSEICFSSPAGLFGSQPEVGVTSLSQMAEMKFIENMGPSPVGRSRLLVMEGIN